MVGLKELMMTSETLKSSKGDLIFRGLALMVVIILYFIFTDIIQPYINDNSGNFTPSNVIEVVNLFSIGFLILVLFITGSLIFTIVNILKIKSSIDSDLELGTNHSSTPNKSDFDKSQAEKIKNDRLYTMGSLAAGIIHDFKNPISNISLCVQSIMQGYAEGNKRDFYLKKIEDQIDRMLNMTQDFLDYAQGQKSIKPQKIEFTETIKNQIEFHRERSEKKNIGLHYSLPSPFYIKIDAHKFRRVLDNIVVNAFEVLKSGQSINIDISTNESGLKMQISDDGPGISPDILSKIFEPFFTHGKSKGSGLGLSISKKIVEDHGGSLTVSSEMDKGTCFTITLPSQLFCRGMSAQIPEKSGIVTS